MISISSSFTRLKTQGRVDRAASRARVCFSAPAPPPSVIYAAPRPGVKQTDQEGGPGLDGRRGRREGRAGRREEWDREEGRMARRREGGKDGQGGRKEGQQRG